MRNFIEKARLGLNLALSPIIFSEQAPSKKASFVKSGLEKANMANLGTRDLLEDLFA